MGMIDKIQKKYFSGKSLDKENLSLQLLKPLMVEYGFMPVANSALAFESINTLCNDLLFNNRKAIIEFGSGISTLILAYLIKSKSLECTFISVEHNKAWIDLLEQQLKSIGAEKHVQFLYAPVGPHPLALDNNVWYQMDNHLSVLQQHSFDCVIIDGPEAHQHDIRRARYPSMPFIQPFLNKDRCFLMLDDAFREGEKDIRQRWKNDFELDFSIKVSKSACCIRGDFFNPIT